MGKVAGRKSVHDIRETCRVRIYPGGIVELMAAERPIFGRNGWEAVETHRRPDRPSERVQRGEASSGDDLLRSIRRARARVRDIALANAFDVFTTLTLDGRRVDRYDEREIVRKLSTWADNEVRRHGLRYVLVPERHKDGAVHFHGFLRWDDLPAEDWLTDSGTLSVPGCDKPRRPRSRQQRDAWLAQGAQVVYNLPRWRLGYSTAIRCYGDYLSAVGYCCKYIGKGMEPDAPAAAEPDDPPPMGCKIGGRWYYSGGRLREPETLYVPLSVRDVADMPGSYAFTVEGAGMCMALWRGHQQQLGGSGGGDAVFMHINACGSGGAG